MNARDRQIRSNKERQMKKRKGTNQDTRETDAEKVRDILKAKRDR